MIRLRIFKYLAMRNVKVKTYRFSLLVDPSLSSRLSRLELFLLEPVSLKNFFKMAPILLGRGTLRRPSCCAFSSAVLDGVCKKWTRVLLWLVFGFSWMALHILFRALIRSRNILRSRSSRAPCIACSRLFMQFSILRIWRWGLEDEGGGRRRWYSDWSEMDASPNPKL